MLKSMKGLVGVLIGLYFFCCFSKKKMKGSIADDKVMNSHMEIGMKINVVFSLFFYIQYLGTLKE